MTSRFKTVAVGRGHGGWHQVGTHRAPGFENVMRLASDGYVSSVGLAVLGLRYERSLTVG